MTRILSPADIIIVTALKGAGILPDEGAAADALQSGTDVRFDALDMDSLDRFEAIMHIEEAFDIELDDDEVTRCATVFEFCDFVAGRLPAGTEAPG